MLAGGSGELMVEPSFKAGLGQELDQFMHPIQQVEIHAQPLI